MLSLDCCMPAKCRGAVEAAQLQELACTRRSHSSTPVALGLPYRPLWMKPGRAPMAAVATQMIAMGGTVSQGKGMAPLVLRLQTMHMLFEAGEP